MLDWIRRSVRALGRALVGSAKPHAASNDAPLHDPEWDSGDEHSVMCCLCGELCDSRTAHLHRGRWIGNECCWDERLRATE